MISINLYMMYADVAPEAMNPTTMMVRIFLLLNHSM